MTLQDAVRKARFGHKDWIGYTNLQGERVHVLANANTLKAAMLATGTQHSFVMICANDGCLLKMSWWIANNVRMQFVRGYR